MSKSPLDLLFGPMFKGPGFVDVRSHAHQFAGRSTINSGSATVVVSTAAVKSDSLIHFAMEGNANRNIIAGVANINSNAASVTVSNAAIAADSLIFLTTRQNGTAQSSGTSNRDVEVVSLATGWASFGFSDGAAISNKLVPVMYHVFPAEGVPGQLEVKTLSDGGYFTIGFADNRAQPRDTKVLWQLTSTTHH